MVTAVPKSNQIIVCCPEIMNISINMYLVCKKKINGNPGSQHVSMLVTENCYLDMNVNVQVQKEGKNALCYSIWKSSTSTNTESM